VIKQMKLLMIRGDIADRMVAVRCLNGEGECVLVSRELVESVF